MQQGDALRSIHFGAQGRDVSAQRVASGRLIRPKMAFQFLPEDHRRRSRQQVFENGITHASEDESPLAPSDFSGRGIQLEVMQAKHLGGSFPSGHASMGFALGAPALLYRRRRPALAALFLAAGLIAGFAVGAARVVQGGHFPTDVLWAGVMVYVAAWTIHRLLLPRFATTHACASANAAGDSSAHRPTQANVRTLSVIIPFFNEQDNVVPVLAEIRSACPHAEIIAVDDGSTDATRERILSVPQAILVSHPRNLGQSAALYSGLTRATGDICAMIDGDGQNDPHDIAALVRALDSADAACGYRATRRDAWQRRAASRIANRIRHAVLRDGIRDTGCMLKAIRRDHVRFLFPFNGMHRFMPALLRNAGLTLVEVPVNHRPRLRGDSKYTISGRARRSLFDLIGVAWLLSRQLRFPGEITVIPPKP